MDMNEEISGEISNEVMGGISADNVAADIAASAEVESNADVAAYDSVDTDDDNDEISDNEEISFQDLGLDELTLKAVEAKGFETPSPIQILAIPRLLGGDANIIAKARTGTGKTAAFGLPLVQEIRSDKGFPQALILTPTRELAMQVCREIESFTTGKYPRLTTVYGGASITSQLRDLKRGVEIVVGTPGRVMDLLDRGALKLDKISYFILDEADEMLDMGFVEDIEKIFGEANPESRILLFSATMPPEILKIASKFMGEYEVVEEEAKPEEPLLTEQHYWVVREGEKIEALVRLIDISPDFYGLVFTQTKVDADAVSKQLDERGYEVAALHGDIPQTQREKILARFRTGKTRILVATDVAARGIDIEGLSHVVNYALPYDGATYIHRIGRTGRAGAKGLAYSFVRPEERRKVEYLKQVAKKATKGVLQEDPVPSVDEVLGVKRARLFGELKAKLSGDVKVSPVFREFVKEICAPVSGAGVPSELCEAAAATAFSAADSRDLEAVGGSALNAESAAGAVCGAGTAGSAESGATNGESEVSDSTPVAVVPGEMLTISAEEMLARLVQLYFGTKLDASRYGNISVSRSGKASDQMRIYIQIGRRDGFNARELSVFLSDLLRIPERLIDRIEITENFSLFSLPIANGKKLLDICSRDKSLPHVHVDTKEGGGKRERGKRDGGSRGGSRGGFGGRSGGKGDFARGGFGGRSGEERGFGRGAGSRGSRRDDFGGARSAAARTGGSDRSFGKDDFGGRGEFGGKGGRGDSRRSSRKEFARGIPRRADEKTGNASLYKKSGAGK